jgi:hypothetical protein
MEIPIHFYEASICPVATSCSVASLSFYKYSFAHTAGNFHLPAVMRNYSFSYSKLFLYSNQNKTAML